MNPATDLSPSDQHGRGHSHGGKEGAICERKIAQGLSAKLAPVRARPVCKVHGCEKSGHMRRGMCGMHYARMRRKGLSKDWQIYHTLQVVSPSAHPLVKNLLKIAAASRVHVQDLEAKSGVGSGTVAQWYRSHGGHRPKVYYPRLAHLEATLNALGYRLCIREIVE